jgi:hypothetical protein
MNLGHIIFVLTIANLVGAGLLALDTLAPVLNSGWSPGA